MFPSPSGKEGEARRVTNLIKSWLLLTVFFSHKQVLKAISDFSASELTIYRKPVQKIPQSICTEKPQWYRRDPQAVEAALTSLVPRAIAKTKTRRIYPVEDLAL